MFGVWEILGGSPGEIKFKCSQKQPNSHMDWIVECSLLFSGETLIVTAIHSRKKTAISLASVNMINKLLTMPLPVSIEVKTGNNEKRFIEKTVLKPISQDNVNHETKGGTSGDSNNDSNNNNNNNNSNDRGGKRMRVLQRYKTNNRNGNKNEEKNERKSICKQDNNQQANVNKNANSKRNSKKMGNENVGSQSKSLLNTSEEDDDDDVIANGLNNNGDSNGGSNGSVTDNDDVTTRLVGDLNVKENENVENKFQKFANKLPPGSQAVEAENNVQLVNSVENENANENGTDDGNENANAHENENENEIEDIIDDELRPTAAQGEDDTDAGALGMASPSHGHRAMTYYNYPNHYSNHYSNHYPPYGNHYSPPFQSMMPNPGFNGYGNNNSNNSNNNNNDSSNNNSNSSNGNDSNSNENESNMNNNSNNNENNNRSNDNVAPFMPGRPPMGNPFYTPQFTMWYQQYFDWYCMYWAAQNMNMNMNMHNMQHMENNFYRSKYSGHSSSNNNNNSNSNKRRKHSRYSRIYKEKTNSTISLSNKLNESVNKQDVNDRNISQDERKENGCNGSIDRICDKNDKTNENKNEFDVTSDFDADCESTHNRMEMKQETLDINDIEARERQQRKMNAISKQNEKLNKQRDLHERQRSASLMSDISKDGHVHTPSTDNDNNNEQGEQKTEIDILSTINNNNNNCLLILVASENEFQLIESILAKQYVRKISISKVFDINAIIFNNSLIVCKIGSGLINAASNLTIIFNFVLTNIELNIDINGVLLLGSAHSLHKSVHAGQIMIAESVIQHDCKFVVENSNTILTIPTSTYPQYRLQSSQIGCNEKLTQWVIKQISNQSEKENGVNIPIVRHGVLLSGSEILSNCQERCQYLLSLLMNNEIDNEINNEINNEMNNERVGDRERNSNNGEKSTENIDDAGSVNDSGNGSSGDVNTNRPVAVDRESASVAQICLKLNKPFAILKTIVAPRMDPPDINQEIRYGGAMIDSNLFLPVIRALLRDYF